MIRFIKDNSYIMFVGGMSGAMGLSVTDWRLWLLIVGTVDLVAWRDTK